MFPPRFPADWPQAVRQARPFAWAMCGLVAGLISFTAATVAAWFLIRAHKIDPQPKYSNCWVYAVPRWVERGGYLGVRPSDHVRLFKRLMVPHAQWIKTTHPPGAMEQWVPVEPIVADTFPIHAVYFRGVVETADESHNARAE